MISTEQSTGKSIGDPREEQLQGVEGVRYWPREHHGAGVLTLAGSSGRIDAARARLLAGHGAITESIRWFGGRSGQPGPWEVPLELFLDRIARLAEHCDRIIVCGTSFGSEAAMLVGAHSPQVTSVFAFAPSDVVWAGVTDQGRITSHWTWAGVPLPFVPFLSGWTAAEDPPSYRDLYRRSWHEQPEHARAAAIPVERITELILIAGGDDRVWPSLEQARRIEERRRLAGQTTVLVATDEAGHRTLLPEEPVATDGVAMQRGGSEEDDRALGREAWTHLHARIAGRR